MEIRQHEPDKIPNFLLLMAENDLTVPGSSYAHQTWSISLFHEHDNDST